MKIITLEKPGPPSRLIGPGNFKGHILTSPNGIYSAHMQQDGNFAVNGKNRGKALWWSGSNGKGRGPYSLALQSDNNIVIYDVHRKAIWTSGTNNKGRKPVRLVMQNDGNLVLYDSTNRFLWGSTQARCCH